MSKKQHDTNKQSTSEESVKDTIARLKANRKQTSILTATQIHADRTSSSGIDNKQETKALTMTAGKRVSKNAKSIGTLDRNNYINHVIKKLLIGELTQGDALKELRVNVLGMKQEAYGRLVNVSRKTLSDIENDRGSYKTEILNKAFKPFGLKVGLIPISPHRLISVLSD